MRQITYAIHEDGHVWSRVGSEVALPVLEFDKMGPENNFAATYHLEKFPVNGNLLHDWRLLTWTKKIPLELKNRHREFWGLPTLKTGKEFEYRWTQAGNLKIRELRA